ncbi:hypothetical protein PROFUN_14449 [Planoprotostelium fungivorum]|uniref:Uncharacterized protein n=1 Tax=Planoprotostelium fungivorum TaxID=1890364 RepID=A0A2P6MXF3_9EUKA|nr:hypothetical protein PROFUN_14449 [Planoprotostelium fungivorum]
MQGRPLLFLVLLWTITTCSADDCYFQNSCQTTLPSSDTRCWNCSSGENIPKADSTIIFQSTSASINLGSLTATDIVVRDSHLTLTDSNISSVHLNVENSLFRLLNTTIVVQESLTVDVNSTGSSIELSNSAVSSSTAILSSAHITFSGRINTFNSTSTRLFNGGRLDIQSDLIWNGLLNVSGSNITTNENRFTVNNHLTTTSWTLQDSTLRAAVLTFKLPLHLIRVTSDAIEIQEVYGLYFCRETHISNSTLQHINRCLLCNVYQSTLNNLPSNSTLHLGGLIRVDTSDSLDFFHQQKVSNSTIEGSSDLVIQTRAYLFMDRVTLNTSETNMTAWTAFTFRITNTIIHGAWNFTGKFVENLHDSMANITGSSTLSRKKLDSIERPSKRHHGR